MIADLVGRIRSLRQQPLLSAATIVTLGVGSAVCCVGVSLLDSILCNPLPYPEPDRLVVAWSVKLDEPDRVRPVSRRVFDEWKSTNRSFAQLAAIRDWPFLMAGSSGPEQYRGALVSEEFLPILGAYMSAGRYFTPEDFGGSGADSAILSHRIWQERFGADAAVIGRSVTLDSRSVTVVGVLGESFAFLPRPNSDIWAPLTLDPDQAAFPDRGSLWVVGRMRDGVTLREAQSELQLVSERLAQSAPDANRDLGARVVLSPPAGSRCLQGLAFGCVPRHGDCVSHRLLHRCGLACVTVDFTAAGIGNPGCRWSRTVSTCAPDRVRHSLDRDIGGRRWSTTVYRSS